MKKSLMFLIMLALVFFSFGCGSSNDSSDSGDDNTNSDEDTADTSADTASDTDQGTDADTASDTDSDTDADTGATAKDFTCAGNPCTTDADCGCDASFCMPEAISAMPGTGPINASRCTAVNCDVSDNSSCPDTGMESEFYECWPLSMGKEYFPEGTESVCMRNALPEDDTDSDAPDTDNTDTDSSDTDSSDTDTTDTDTTDTDTTDTDTAESNWPACYGNDCQDKSECCDGTTCLPSAMGAMIGTDKTNYCVIEGCVEGDDSTCPEGYYCKSAMGIKSYCLIKE